MKIHEFQARDLLKAYGINVPPGRVASTPAEAKAIAAELGGSVVVKAQVLVGGRGKAGGVKLASSAEDAEAKAKAILNLTIKELPVEKVLVAHTIEIEKEFYISVTLDRAKKKAVLIGSAAGGVEIEDLAVKEPEKILLFEIDPVSGIDSQGLDAYCKRLFGEPKLAAQGADTFRKMYKLFKDKDCSLVEVNPYAKLPDGTLIAADAKINFDDNGVFLHPELEKLRNPEEYSKDEIAAKEAGLSFVSLDGDIGCIVNGAGLAMATMDIIKLFGGDPANFLDVGGSSNPEKVLNALKILTSNKKLKAILINIFGGITRCDDIANGIVMAKRQIDLTIPMVIRLIGTNEEAGRKILQDEGMAAAENLSDAVKMVVERSREGLKA
ncbi:MAG TPA: ADP-forming succinate--CoA ligase subunit beta [Spirochaetia bacterium]|nr:ADP-forming succinate--CoA ligase subunit beta [Spirochaetia bacterium]